MSDYSFSLSGGVLNLPCSKRKMRPTPVFVIVHACVFSKINPLRWADFGYYFVDLQFINIKKFMFQNPGALKNKL